ncbi:TPA: hypothetical protein DIC38_01885 [Candidatus Nomurabacteria bacterium]|nr:MAG: hypothetical protein O210_OD1C00001G0354 [Parcubacteria bacterium RAAC4_OD1_1]HCY26409.1 hypothetical protein [Candidatus Nomurabacteria bacterium]
MYNIKILFGILSAVFTFLGIVPYFFSIHKKEIHPHNLSWLGWAFITFIGGLAMLSEGGEWSVIILFANTLSCVLVVIYSVYKKVGVWSTTTYDYMFFGLGILGVVLWQITDIALVAVVCAVLADLFFGIPTIIKTYKNPKSELALAWGFCSLAGLFSLFAVNNFMPIEFLYPLYLFIFDTLVLLLVVFRKGKKG